MAIGPKDYTVNNLKILGNNFTLNNATNNLILFPTAGASAPTCTTRSVGTKICLYPQLSATVADYAIGIEASILWNSVPSTAQSFKWYAGTAPVATLSGTGSLLVTGAGAALTVTETDSTANAAKLYSDTWTGTLELFASGGSQIKLGYGDNSYINLYSGKTLTLGSDVNIGADGVANRTIRINTGAAGYYGSIVATTGGLLFSGTNLPLTIFSSGSNLNLKASYSTLFQNNAGTTVAEIDNTGNLTLGTDTSGNRTLKVYSATGGRSLKVFTDSTSSGNFGIESSGAGANAYIGSVNESVIITPASGKYVSIFGMKHYGKLSAAPSSPAESDRYYNTATHKEMIYDGTTWQACW